MNQTTIKRGLKAAERRLASIEKQMLRCEQGKATVINCPYCHESMPTDVPPEEFSVGQCCPSMIQAFIAIVKRRMTKEQLSKVAEITQRYADIQRQAVLDQTRLLIQ